MRAIGATKGHARDEGVPRFVAAIEIGAVVGEGLVELHVLLFEILHRILTALAAVDHQPGDEFFEHDLQTSASTLRKGKFMLGSNKRAPFRGFCCMMPATLRLWSQRVSRANPKPALRNHEQSHSSLILKSGFGRGARMGTGKPGAAGGWLLSRPVSTVAARGSVLRSRRRGSGRTPSATVDASGRLRLSPAVPIQRAGRRAGWRHSQEPAARAHRGRRDPMGPPPGSG